MKIKKFNESYNEDVENKLNDYREKYFNTTFVRGYNLWGETLNDDYKPDYDLLVSDSTIELCIKYHKNHELENKIYNKIILQKNTMTSEILDFDLYINTDKYNL